MRGEAKKEGKEKRRDLLLVLLQQLLRHAVGVVEVVLVGGGHQHGVDAHRLGVQAQGAVVAGEARAAEPVAGQDALLAHAGVSAHRAQDVELVGVGGAVRDVAHLVAVRRGLFSLLSLLCGGDYFSSFFVWARERRGSGLLLLCETCGGAKGIRKKSAGRRGRDARVGDLHGDEAVGGQLADLGALEVEEGIGGPSGMEGRRGKSRGQRRRTGQKERKKQTGRGKNTRKKRNLGGHPADGGLVLGHALVVLLQVVPDGVGSLADEDHVGLQQPLDDVSLGDELGVVGDGDVGGVAQDLGGDVVDVPRHDGAPDDDVLVGQLVAVDLLQQVVQLRDARPQ